MGPVEYIEFAYDEHEICENYALVVFKHTSSVEDSIKFFQGTVLYGLPIITKNYSKHFEDPVFNDQLNYFKQLVKVERNSQPNNSFTESRWIDQSLDDNNIIPETLPVPPMHEVHRSDNVTRHGSKDNSIKYKHNVPHTKSHNLVNRSEYNPIDKFHHSRKHYKKSEHNRGSGSMEVFNYDQDSYHNQNNDSRHQDNDNTSFNRKESTFYNQEHLLKHEKNSTKGDMLVRDLRDTMLRKRSRLDSNFHFETNAKAGCTSLLDLRDTMYHSKNSKYEDLGQQHYESNPNNRWLERNNDTPSSSKNNFNSECYNESNTKHQNHYTDRSYNHDKSHDGFQEYSNNYPNNYNDGYRRDKNRPINHKFNNPHNMQSSNRQHSSYHPYKRNNEGHERKNYNNMYDEQSGPNRGRSYNRGCTDQSKHSYYS